MTYEAFIKYKEYVDPENHLVHAYEDEEGNRFYVEPGFYEGLMGFKEKRSERFDELMDAIDSCIKKNHKVILTADFTDPLAIFVEDKSRGSDYGD